MGRRFGLVFGASLGFAASGASAGMLTMATWSQVTQGVPMTRTISQLHATGSAGAGSVSLSLTYPQTTVSVFQPKTFDAVLDLHIRITQGGRQAITATRSMANADTGVPGGLLIKTAKHAVGSMLSVGDETLLPVPLRHGKAEVFTDHFAIIDLPHTLTAFHYAWTPGSLFFEDLSTGGMALSNVLTEGSFHISYGVGAVTLVAPTLLVVRGRLANRTTVSVTRLTLYFPEPGTGVLLAAAGGALLLAGARNRR